MSGSYGPSDYTKYLKDMYAQNLPVGLPLGSLSGGAAVQTVCGGQLVEVFPLQIILRGGFISRFVVPLGDCFCFGFQVCNILVIGAFQSCKHSWQAQFDFSKQQYQDSLSQYQDSINAQNRDNAYNLAMTMLSAGVMPDTNTLTTAGISTADAMAIRLAALGGSSGGSSSGSSKGSSSSAKKTSTASKTGTTADVSGNTILKVDQENLPSYSTVLGNSESGYYGPAYGITLSTVQAMMNQKATKDQVEEYLLEQMDAGKINEYGVATILQALGTQRG